MTRENDTKNCLMITNYMTQNPAFLTGFERLETKSERLRKELGDQMLSLTHCHTCSLSALLQIPYYVVHFLY